VFGWSGVGGKLSWLWKGDYFGWGMNLPALRSLKISFDTINELH
jgi:hypothetical protein